MKNISLSIIAGFMLLAGFNANAQVKVESGETAAQMVQGSDSTAGGLLLLPAQSQEDAIAVLEKEEPVIKNVAHKRNKKFGQMVNGYYKMEGSRDWGTNARLNAYGYEQIPPAPAYNPEADMPVYPAGVEEGAEGSVTPAADGQTETGSESNGQLDW